MQLLGQHSVLSLATIFEGRPHAVSLIYASDGFAVFWVSDPRARHSRAIGRSSEASITVADHFEDFASIRGLCCAGTAIRSGTPAESAHGMDLLAHRFSFLREFRHGPQALAGALEATDFASHLSISAPHAATVSDGLAAELAIVGSIGECQPQLAAIAAIGVDRITVSLLSGGREDRLDELLTVWEGVAL